MTSELLPNFVTSGEMIFLLFLLLHRVCYTNLIYIFMLWKWKIMIKIHCVFPRSMFCESCGGVNFNLFFQFIFPTFRKLRFVFSSPLTLNQVSQRATHRRGRKNISSSLPSFISLQFQEPSNLLRRIFNIIAIWQWNKKAFLIYFAITWRFNVNLENYFEIIDGWCLRELVF